MRKGVVQLGFILTGVMLAAWAGAVVVPAGTPVAQPSAPSTGALSRSAPGTVMQDMIMGLTVKASGGKLLITAVQAGGVAQQAGLRVGDVIVAVNGQPDLTLSQLVGLLGGPAQQQLTFSVQRSGQADLSVFPVTSP